MMEAGAGEGRPASKAEFLAMQNPQETRDQAASILRDGPFAQEGDYRGAVDKFGLAVKGKPELNQDPWVNYDMGVCMVRLGGEGNVNRGIRLLENAVRIQEQSEEPVNEWMHLGLAEAYGRADRYDDAKKEYEAARAVNPDNEQVAFLDGDEEYRGDRAWALHDEAKTDASEGRNLLSLIKYERAIILGGEETMAWSTHDKGKVLLASNHFDESAREFHRAMQLMPNETWPHSGFAMALERMDIPHTIARAREEYETALRLDPGNHEAQEGLERLGRTTPEQQQPGQPEEPAPQVPEHTDTTAADKGGLGGILRRFGIGGKPGRE